MESKRAVNTVALGLSRELLGPAEGQYVTFQGTLATNAGPDTCFDVYDFDLGQDAEEVCVTLSIGSALPDGALYAGLVGWDSGGDCLWITDGTAKMYAGESSVEVCVPSGGTLAAGSYSVFVSGMPDSTPISYTIRIEATVPILNAQPDENEICESPGCLNEA